MGISHPGTLIGQPGRLRESDTGRSLTSELSAAFNP
jgi:hypothetical protein